MVRCPSPLRLRRLAKVAGFALFSEGPEGVVLLTRRDAGCLSYVQFWWRAWHFWGILRSKTLFCVTGARHRILFHSHGRRGTGESEKCFWKSFCMAGAIFRELGRRFERIEKSRFVKKCRHFKILDMMLIPCGRCGTSDASGSFGLIFHGSRSTL